MIHFSGERFCGAVSVCDTREMTANLHHSRTITEHLKNIFESGELDEQAVCRNSRHIAEGGKDYTTRLYNLDAIITSHSFSTRA